MKYQLEIFPPGNKYDTCCSMESDAPFMAIQKGDLINPRTWDPHWFQTLRDSFPTEHGAVLRVTGVEHLLTWTPDGITRHILQIYTEGLEDVEESRP